MKCAAVCFLVIGLLSGYSAASGVFHNNSYDVIQGCLQYDAIRGYDDPLDYFATVQFRNVIQRPNSKVFRLGVVGKNDFHVRFGKSAFPYGISVTELVICGWGNTASEGRRQTRTSRSSNTNVMLKHGPTPNLMSQYRPLMMLLEVFNNGTVTMTRDGDELPFFEFADLELELSVDYMAFCKWDKDLVYFYDCPLRDANKPDDTVTLKCNLVDD